MSGRPRNFLRRDGFARTGGPGGGLHGMEAGPPRILADRGRWMPAFMSQVPTRLFSRPCLLLPSQYLNGVSGDHISLPMTLVLVEGGNLQSGPNAVPVPAKTVEYTTVMDNPFKRLRAWRAGEFDIRLFRERVAGDRSGRRCRMRPGRGQEAGE